MESQKEISPLLSEQEAERQALLLLLPLLLLPHQPRGLMQPGIAPAPEQLR